MIEEKMNMDDRKVWFCFLEGANDKSCMRATAPVRSPANTHAPTVNLVLKATDKKSNSSFKCWLCQTSDHWIDQCPRLASMKPTDRLTAMKDNHAHYSCMKKAGETTTCRHVLDVGSVQRWSTECSAECSITHFSIYIRLV